MTKIKYLKITNSIKIRYLTNKISQNLNIVFLHGFMSDINGEKPKIFNKFCNLNKLGFGNRVFWTWKIHWKIY